LIDEYGPSFVVKIPTTSAAEMVVRNEGRTLEALGALPLGRLSATLPRPIGLVSHDGRKALVSTALVGAPMTVSYHAWHHTSRRRMVRRDFAAAENWLSDLQTRTAGSRASVSLFGESVDRISRQFADHPQLAVVKRVLRSSAGRFSSLTTPRTVVHGDFWFGNLLMHDNRINGVVDWESCDLSGEPLRDIARFAISYALYLDRHTKPNHRVHGHRGLRADNWGAGVTHMLKGRGWFSKIAQNYMTLALGRLGLPTHLWRDVLVGGIAEVAATADHPEFAQQHFELLARVIPAVPTIASVPPIRPVDMRDDRYDHDEADSKPTVRNDPNATVVINKVKPMPDDEEAKV
jgi:aminoglycoside phosphotransferase